MQYPRIALASALLIATLTPSHGEQAQPKRSERITITSCPYAGVTANCLMIRAPDGTVYNISGVAPRPRRSDRMIRVRGLATTKASACGEGIVLDRIRWTRTRQRCPN